MNWTSESNSTLMNDFENFSREGMDYKWIYVYVLLLMSFYL